MTSLTDTQVVTASGGLVELGYVQRTTAYEHSANTVAGASDVFATDLTFVADGSPVLVEFYTPSLRILDGAHGAYVHLVDASGTDLGILARFFDQLSPDGETPGHCSYRYTPAAGAVTINVRGVSSASGQRINFAGGAAGSATNMPMYLRVSKIVQATQWPAVTTGTIICTSSTRPASPFEGQMIYETDTGLSLIYDGSAWVSPSVTHKPPSVKLERTTGQVVYDASAAIMVWDSEVWDTDGMHDNAINQDRITVNTPGIYLVIGAVRYSAGVSDDSSVTIWLNGSTFIVRDEGGPANTAGGRTVSALVNMNANDYLHLQVYQNNSANTSRTTTSGTFFSAAWIGQA